MEKYTPPFTITNEMISLISIINEYIGKIDCFDNLYKFPTLRKQNRIRSIHSSCAIEANSLSIDQVKDVINGVKVFGPEKDIMEVINAIEAYKHIEEINPLKEEEIKRIHHTLTKNITIDAGQYRNGNEGVFDEKGNVIFVAPPPSMVPLLMDNLFKWMNQENKNLNPLILSSVFHYEFVFIHPFSDGNGRTARIWQIAILGKWRKIFYWLPIENQIQKHQNDYYKTINESHIKGTSNSFIVFMLKMIKSTLEEIIKDTNDLSYSYSIYQERLMKNLKPGIWYTSNQILSLLNLKSKQTLRKHYIDPALRNGIMISLYPQKSTSKNQRYKILKVSKM